MKRTKNPLLSDIPARSDKFSPGDRIIVRVSTELTADQQYKLKKAVTKFCGDDVRILLVNCTYTRVVVFTDISSHPESLAGPEHYQHQPELQNVANLNCAKVDLREGCRLVVLDTRPLSQLQLKDMLKVVKNWAGDNTEVAIKRWKIGEERVSRSCQ